MNDPVNPSHYKGDTVMRIIDELNLGVCLGNVVKYMLVSRSSNYSHGKDDMSVVHRCDNKDCNMEIHGIKLPRGWSKLRGFVAPEDRRPRQGARSVMHFCAKCSAIRQQAKDTLDKMRMRVG